MNGAEFIDRDSWDKDVGKGYQVTYFGINKKRRASPIKFVVWGSDIWVAKYIWLKISNTGTIEGFLQWNGWERALRWLILIVTII